MLSGPVMECFSMDHKLQTFSCLERALFLAENKGVDVLIRELNRASTVSGTAEDLLVLVNEVKEQQRLALVS